MYADESHYETLKVMRDAPPEVVRAAYKVLSQKCHPDRNPSATAGHQMAALNAAYETLSDTTKRRQYDQKLADDMAWTFAHPRVYPSAEPSPAKARQHFDVDWSAVSAAQMTIKRSQPSWPRQFLIFVAVMVGFWVISFILRP